MAIVMSIAYSGSIEIDLDAIAANVASLRARLSPSRPPELMAIVKADGYGHGMLPAARAALAGGADWLGVAQPREALALREAGVRAPIFSWLFAPGSRLDPLIAADIHLSASATWALDELALAAERAGRRASVHLKIDTGMARAGATAHDWPEVLERALVLQSAGRIEVAGIWSHLVAADEPGHPSLAPQKEAFEAALAVAADHGLEPRWRHLANSAGLLHEPDTHYDLVRPGLAIYGLTPLPQLGGPELFGLRPAMTLNSSLALVKEVAAGQGVSYGHSHVTSSRTTLGLVPLGYGDGIPRHASNTAAVWVGGRRARIVGRVCMDQFVVDLGADAADKPGEPVRLFGPAMDAAPTAQDWAEAAGTISYEIVTRMSSRLPRTYVTADDALAEVVS